MNAPSGPSSMNAPSGPSSMTSPAGPSSMTSPAGPSSMTSPAGPSSMTSPSSPTGPSSMTSSSSPSGVWVNRNLAELQEGSVECLLGGRSCENFENVRVFGRGRIVEIAELANKLNRNCQVKCVDAF